MKRTKCQYFNHPPRASETVPDGFSGFLVLDTVPRHSSKRVCLKKSLPPWCDMNETFLKWIWKDWLYGKQLLYEFISKWQATSLMLIPASAMPITFSFSLQGFFFLFFQLRSTLVGLRDSTYPNFIKFLLLADVFFPLLICFN